MIQEAIEKIVLKHNLSEDETVAVFEEIMTGEATPAQVGSFITALRMKGENVSEITGAAKVMRSKAVKIDAGGEKVVDTCGTGGDKSGTFNISTTAAFVAAGAGAKVAKHGNRSVSSKSGSADVLKELGVTIEAEKSLMERSLREAGICFLFAPLMHGAMKYAIGPRREIGIRTIFNVLGPLTNPAGATSQVIGVYDPLLTKTIADVLQKLGSDHVFVVHGRDGLDEITLTGDTTVSELKNGKVTTSEWSPTDFGLRVCSPDELKGGDATVNAKITLDILQGAKGPKRDISLLNGAAALLVAGRAPDIREGIAMAAESIDSGRALQALNGLKRITGEC